MNAISSPRTWMWGTRKFKVHITSFKWYSATWWTSRKSFVVQPKSKFQKCSYHGDAVDDVLDLQPSSDLKTSYLSLEHRIKIKTLYIYDESSWHLSFDGSGSLNTIHCAQSLFQCLLCPRTEPQSLMTTRNCPFCTVLFIFLASTDAIIWRVVVAVNFAMSVRFGGHPAICTSQHGNTTHSSISSCTWRCSPDTAIASISTKIHLIELVQTRFRRSEKLSSIS